MHRETVRIRLKCLTIKVPVSNIPITHPMRINKKPASQPAVESHFHVVHDVCLMCPIGFTVHTHTHTRANTLRIQIRTGLT